MISPLVGQITLGIYAVLLGAGGLIGYLKAGSRASLIAGSISALAAALALGLSIRWPPLGYSTGIDPVRLAVYPVRISLRGQDTQVHAKRSSCSGQPGRAGSDDPRGGLELAGILRPCTARLPISSRPHASSPFERSWQVGGDHMLFAVGYRANVQLKNVVRRHVVDDPLQIAGSLGQVTVHGMDDVADTKPRTSLPVFPDRRPTPSSHACHQCRSRAFRRYPDNVPDPSPLSRSCSAVR